MKRHLERVAETIVIPQLSVEEEAILADEYSEAELALDGQTAEVERITEISDVVNDVDVVVSDVPEVGTVEESLIAAVADMAVAGTDTNPEEILGVTTADGAIATEGIAATLKKIWNAIVTSIKNMWVGLKHWLTTYFSTLEQNKRHAEALIKKLDGMKGYVPNIDNDKIQIVDIFNYYDRFNLLKASAWFGPSGPDVEEAKFSEFVTNAVGIQSAVMMPMGRGLTDAYKAYDGLDGSKLSGIIDGLTNNMGGYCQKLGLKEGAIHNQKELFGVKIANMKVVAKNYSTNIASGTNSVETKIAFLSKIRFEASQYTEFSSPARIMFQNDVTPDILKAEVVKRAKMIDGLLHMKGGDFKSLEAQVDAVQKACDDMLKRIKEDNKEGVANAKRLMLLSSAYANWATQPMAKLMQLSARHSKFWLSLCEMVSNNFVKP